MSKALRILGTRGIPARYGGFETFAENLALYLTARDWNVSVYCQDDHGRHRYEEDWRGVRLLHIPVSGSGALGSIPFDWKSTLDAARHGDLALTLGYNTALFCSWLRLRGTPNIMNMGGIDWLRPKWSLPVRGLFYVNERLGCLLADHLVADHPEIERHLRTRVRPARISMIAYGADRVDDADPAHVRRLGLEPGGYAVIICRPEPGHSLLEIVRAFSRRPRPVSLVILGRYLPDRNAFHRRVMDAAGPGVIFPGAIYDRDVVQSLRLHARLYVHGHFLGGTNPSLVESLGAGAPVLARDNRFNRWVAGPAAHYFSDEDGCSSEFDRLLEDDAELSRMRLASWERHGEQFTWARTLGDYEKLLTTWLPC